MTASRETKAAPAWSSVLVRTLQIALVAFVALVAKEWSDTRETDFGATAIDAAWVAGATFLFYAALKAIEPKPPASGGVG